MLTRNSIKLPGVSVVAPYYSHPYTSGVGPKASPNGRVRTEHYQAPSDYVTNIAMHSYASRIGPKAGPNHTLRVEHYEVPPDFEAHVAMHPYTSGIGPSENGPGSVRETWHPLLAHTITAPPALACQIVHDARIGYKNEHKNGRRPVRR